ncbi:MAG TPA: polysaccharide deacetylase family protein, partial [Caldilineaceae bacterium]|nr:polysaccharide deacetylase family protein [Caldilineaceae bacterium]
LGAHTHRHPQLSGLPPSRLEEELAWPVERFKTELGIQVAHFSYPRALYDPEVMARAAQYYETAVVGGGQLASSNNWNPYCIPRVPIRRSDGWLFFLAKLWGGMASEEVLYQQLRRLRRVPANVLAE